MVSKQPDAEQMKRLVLVKYLHNLGIQQSKQPPIQAVSCLLTFHDAVELFFQIAADYLGIEKKIVNFMDYWMEINERLKKDSKALTDRAAIDKLNRARVDLKHHALFTYDYNEFRASITGFFEDNTPVVFGIAFDSISMINLVTNAGAKAKLEEAATLLQADKIGDAMQRITEGFDLLLEDYEQKSQEGEISSFPFGYSYSSFEGQSEALAEMQEAFKVLFIGHDLQKYYRFKRILPPHGRLSGGDYLWYDMSNSPNQKPRTKEDAHFCMDFVIDTAIRLQEFDYEKEE